MFTTIKDIQSLIEKHEKVINKPSRVILYSDGSGLLQYENTDSLHYHTVGSFRTVDEIESLINRTSQWTILEGEIQNLEIQIKAKQYQISKMKGNLNV
jgi:hypothetical protein